MAALLLVGLVLALLFLRQSLIVILFGVGAYVHLVWGQGRLEYMIEDMWNGADKEVLLAIPLFILAGSVMTRGAIAQRLIAILVALSRPVAGGLAVATVLSCASFAAISGSSPVTMLAVGSIMYPALLKHGYGRKFALGVVCSGGTLGIIIPPSIPMIIYGIVTETSVTDLFVAGIGPGLLLTALLAFYSWWANRDKPAERFDPAELRRALRQGIWAALMPAILLGGVYSGYFTATESAAVALVYALLIEVFVHRELRLTDFGHIAIETVKTLGTLFPVLAIAFSLNLLLAAERVPNLLIDWMTALIQNPWAFLLGVNLFLLILGCLMDVSSALLITAPLLLPLARAYGFDPVHFGIVMVVNLEIGFLTPPVGINLIVAMSAFKENFLLICRAVVPFILLMLLGLAAVSAFPAIALFLVR
ncbi:MAG: TRAP transporter large permease [Alphaproteobacteria bacterium]|nr:TRAP transporter large permease [Alphaproteobacteria bacterium]